MANVCNLLIKIKTVFTVFEVIQDLLSGETQLIPIFIKSFALRLTAKGIYNYALSWQDVWNVF